MLHAIFKYLWDTVLHHLVTKPLKEGEKGDNTN